MLDPAIYLAVDPILFIVGIDVIFGDEGIFLHVTKCLVKAGIRQHGVDKILRGKVMRMDVDDRRIDNNGADSIGVEWLVLRFGGKSEKQKGES